VSETRKLAAILVADIVGYSRLAGADEDRTLARLRTLRSDLIDPAIAAHHGRIVKGTGDGAIVEFRSVVDTDPGLKTARAARLPRSTARWLLRAVPALAPFRATEPSADARPAHLCERRFHMPPGLRLLLLVSIFAGDGALSRFGDSPIAVRLPELPRIFSDHSFLHG
jgi:hypothetical protein